MSEIKINRRPKILFILPSLRPGGAERVFSFLAQNISKEKYEAHLLVIGYEEDSAYDISGISLTYLNKKRVLHAVPKLVGFLITNKFHVVLSSIGHLNTIMAMLKPFFFRKKFVIREASVISVISKFSTQKKTWYSRLARICYPWLDAVICQSKDMAEDFKTLYKIKDDRLIIIGNPITNTKQLSDDRVASTGRKWITVGRLSKEKGHERLLKMLSKLQGDFQYTIIGDGKEWEYLMQLIEKLELQSKITHIPFTKKVNDYLLAHDYFLQGSYVEGFPNAVLESCALGTPVIAFNVPGGTREILENSVNGFLVENEEEYIAHLNNPRSLSNRKVSASVHDKFSELIVLSKYEALLDRLILA